jgi:hypothetical protein
MSVLSSFRASTSRLEQSSRSFRLCHWAKDGRPVIALVPEFDDYLQPPEAKIRFAPLTQMEIIAVDGAKHLWVGEPSVYRVVSEITKVLAPERLPLPTEI